MSSPELSRILDAALDDSFVENKESPESLMPDYRGSPLQMQPETKTPPSLYDLTSAPEAIKSPPRRVPMQKGKDYNQNTMRTAFQRWADEPYNKEMQGESSPEPTATPTGLTSAPEAFKSPPNRVPRQRGRPVKLKNSPTPSPPGRRVFKPSARKKIPSSLRRRKKPVVQKLPEDVRLQRDLTERQDLGLEDKQEEDIALLQEVNARQKTATTNLIQQADTLENQGKELSEIKAQVAEIHEMVVLGIPLLLKNAKAQNENARLSQLNQEKMGDRLKDLKKICKEGFKNSRHFISNNDCLTFSLVYSPKKLLECILRLGMFLIRSFGIASWVYFEYVDRLGIFVGKVAAGVPFIGPMMGEVIINVTRLLILMIGAMFYFAMLSTLIGKGPVEGGGIVVRVIISLGTMFYEAFGAVYASCGVLISTFGEMLEAGGALEPIQALREWSWNMMVSCKDGIVWFISEAAPAAARETVYATGRAAKGAAKFVVDIGISGIYRLGGVVRTLFNSGQDRLGEGTRKKKKKDKGRTKRRKRGHKHKTRGKRKARRRTRHAAGKIEIHALQRLNDNFNSSKIIRSIDSIVMNDVDANYSSIGIIQGDMEMFYMVLNKTLEQAEESILSFIDTMKFNKKFTVSQKERDIALKETPRLINNAIQKCLDTLDPNLELIDASNEELLLYLEDTMPQPE